MRLAPSILLAFVVVSCGKRESDPPLKQLQPTAPMALSPGNGSGQDEDPSILVARDGTLFAAWYSNRLGTHPSGRERKELFVIRSTDGSRWTDPPAQVTESSEWSFYPSLAQDGAAVFHLTWMRWHLLPEGCVPAPAPCGGAAPACCTGLDKRVMYNSSPDGLGWSEANAVELAAGPADELASIVAASDGRLLVYYVSGFRGGDTDKQIYVVVHDGTGWGTPAPANGANSISAHDTFPHVVERAPGSFLMTFTRYDHAYGDNYLNPSAETMLSTSADGLNWSAPVALSGPSPALTDVFPYLYADHARQRWFVVWVNENGTLEMPIDGAFPADVRSLDLPGYTPRIAASPTPGIYWGAWVEGAHPTQKVKQRFLAK